jgi:hypothetical protein
MTRKLQATLAFLVSAIFLMAALPAQASTPVASVNYVEGSDSQAFLFNPLRVNKFEITMTPADEAALRATPTDYHTATVRLTTSKGVTALFNVGVRIKGGWGSYRDLESKTAFKIKMNFSVKGQSLFGIKKFTLNNMVQDGSMLHEATAYRLFRALGVPAPRVGYANVFFNGVNYGLHSNIETYDNEMFSRWGLGDTEHLYEGGYGTEVGPDMQVDDGSQTDKADVTELQAINNNYSGAEWYDRVRTRADLNEMTMDWAVEHYIGHWDGYTRGWPNNYFIHRTKNGLFTMHPWGTDQTWVQWNALIDNGATMMTKCIAYQPCNELYQAALSRIEQVVPTLDLPGMVDHIWEVIAPSNVADPRKPYSSDDSVGAVAATKNFMISRFPELLTQNASRILPTLTATYPTNRFTVNGVVKPNLSRTGNGQLSFTRLQGDGVCDVDSSTGWVVVHRGGTCWVAIAIAQSSTYQAAMKTVQIKIPVLASRIAVAPFGALSKGRTLSLAVTTDSAIRANAKRASGSCIVSGLNVRATASQGICKVTLSVAGDGTFGKATKTLFVKLKR